MTIGPVRLGAAAPPVRRAALRSLPDHLGTETLPRDRSRNPVWDNELNLGSLSRSKDI
jgi:hypothetical protein